MAPPGPGIWGEAREPITGFFPWTVRAPECSLSLARSPVLTVSWDRDAVTPDKAPGPSTGGHAGSAAPLCFFTQLFNLSTAASQGFFVVGLSCASYDVSQQPPWLCPLAASSHPLQLLHSQESLDVASVPRGTKLPAENHSSSRNVHPSAFPLLSSVTCESPAGHPGHGPFTSMPAPSGRPRCPAPGNMPHPQAPLHPAGHWDCLSAFTLHSTIYPHRL